MRLLFKIHFHTQWGQKLKVCGSLPELGNWEQEKALNLNYITDGHWELDVDINLKNASDFSYKYFLYFEESGWVEWEFGNNRVITVPSKKYDIIEIQDTWRSFKDVENVFATNAFTKAIFSNNLSKEKITKPKFKKGKGLLQF